MRSEELPNPVPIDILRKMSPGQRWVAARQLYWTVRRHKAAFLRSQHPEWSEEQVQSEIRRIFLQARS
jgi:hypothetical protein